MNINASEIFTIYDHLEDEEDYYYDSKTRTAWEFRTTINFAFNIFYAQLAHTSNLPDFTLLNQSRPP